MSRGGSCEHVVLHRGQRSRPPSVKLGRGSRNTNTTTTAATPRGGTQPTRLPLPPGPRRNRGRNGSAMSLSCGCAPWPCDGWTLVYYWQRPAASIAVCVVLSIPEGPFHFIWRHDRPLATAKGRGLQESPRAQTPHVDGASCNRAAALNVRVCVCVYVSAWRATSPSPLSSPRPRGTGALWLVSAETSYSQRRSSFPSLRLLGGPAQRSKSGCMSLVSVAMPRVASPRRSPLTQIACPAKPSRASSLSL